MTDSAREMAPPTEDETTDQPKYLTFVIDTEIYALPIEHVREIIGTQKITVVPDVPSYIRGVINLRGKVIPVLDVRARFKLELRPYDDRTCIVVIECADWIVGLVVDTVSEVLDIPKHQIEPPPRAFGNKTSHYVAGMGKVGEHVRLIIDVARLLDQSELGSL